MKEDENEKLECGTETESLVSDEFASVPGRTIFNGGVFSALGTRDFGLLWGGALVSNIGTWIQTTVLLWYVKELTGSNSWVGAVNLASYLPVLIFSLVAGSLADRLNRKKMILVTQLIMMAGACSLAVITALDAASIPAIMVIVAVMGLAFAFSHPAWMAIIPDVVKPEDLLNGVALNSAQYNLARFIGPALGAIILAWWNAAGGFLVNSISFVFVVLAVLLVRTRTPSIATDRRTYSHIMEALRYAWTNRWARYLLFMTAYVSFFGMAYLVLSPAMAQDVLNRGTSGYGMLLMSTGLGAFLAAPLVTFLDRHIRKGLIIKSATGVAGLCLVGFSISRIFWLSLVFCFFLGLSYLMVMATINTTLQARTGREMRGRIMSFYILMLIGIFPIGGQVMGIVADLWSAPIAILICGIAILVFAFTIIIFPGIIQAIGNYKGPEN